MVIFFPIDRYMDIVSQKVFRDPCLTPDNREISCL